MKLQADICKQIAKDSAKGYWGQMVLKGFFASLLGTFTNPFYGIFKLAVLSAGIIYFFENVPFYHEVTMIAVFIIAFIWFFIGSFVRLGYLDYNLSMLDQRNPSDSSLFGSGTIWWNAFELRIVIWILTAIGTVFFIIPGIMIYYSYAMAPFLLEEKTDLSVSEALAYSRRMMKGHRMQFFGLRMSFLGWKLFGFLTLGIGFLYVNPYYALTETVFFNEASGRADSLYERE